MEIVSVKFQEEILEKLDSSMKKHNFNTRTEFIREAVRDKLSVLEREELIKKFMSLRGKFKRKSSPGVDRKIREQVSKELMEEINRRFK